MDLLNSDDGEDSKFYQEVIYTSQPTRDPTSASPIYSPMGRKESLKTTPRGYSPTAKPKRRCLTYPETFYLTDAFYILFLTAILLFLYYGFYKIENVTLTSAEIYANQENISARVGENQVLRLNTTNGILHWIYQLEKRTRSLLRRRKGKF